jgi:hypothetical protein
MSPVTKNTMKKALIGGIAALAILGGAAVVWLKAAGPAPTIDSVGADPAYVVINTPTEVLFTAKITNPNVQPGVNLLKVDASGKTLSTVGAMNDNGANGDRVAGDKTFSLKVNVNEPAVGQTYYRVSAPFKGTLQRTLSSVIGITLDPVQLPPDPGEVGKQTLEGIDSDRDGVRDDIQRYVAYKYLSSARTRRAVTQYAKAAESFLLSGTDTASSLSLAHAIDDGITCVYALSPSSAHDDVQSLRAILVNTKERSYAWVNANSAISGNVFDGVPKADEVSRCDFNPNDLQN